jgi:hypothetical protein
METKISYHWEVYYTIDDDGTCDECGQEVKREKDIVLHTFNTEQEAKDYVKNPNILKIRKVETRIYTRSIYTST